MVVADGMGGHYYGEIAAQIAVQTLVESFQREANPTITDPFLFLQKSMMNAHRAIADFSATHRLKDSPRTTCVASIIQHNVAYWAHSGDSRLYLMRNGRVITHTRDHSRVQLRSTKGSSTRPRPRCIRSATRSIAAWGVRYNRKSNFPGKRRWKQATYSLKVYRWTVGRDSR